LRRRANTASTPIPNNATIGGSGTWVPELVLVLEVLVMPPLVEELVEVEELLEVEELVELLVELLDVTLPDEDEVEVTLPELLVVVLVMPPVLVEVELPPDEVEVDEPPLEVEVELPLTLITVPPLLLELPEEEPLVVVVELIETLPPPLLPPTKPPTKPPPKPPNPLDPPITTGVLPPPDAIGTGAGSGTAAIANCCASMQTCSPLRSTSCFGASHS
jgi:hypothetical protein